MHKLRAPMCARDLNQCESRIEQGFGGKKSPLGGSKIQTWCVSLDCRIRQGALNLRQTA